MSKMARRNSTVAYQMKEFKRQVDAIVPQVYSAIALILSEDYGWEHEQIAELFGKSENLWIESAETGMNIVAKTYEETGILTISPYQAKEWGITIKEGDEDD